MSARWRSILLVTSALALALVLVPAPRHAAPALRPPHLPARPATADPNPGKSGPPMAPDPRAIMEATLLATLDDSRASLARRAAAAFALARSLDQRELRSLWRARLRDPALRRAAVHGLLLRTTGPGAGYQIAHAFGIAGVPHTSRIDEGIPFELVLDYLGDGGFDAGGRELLLPIVATLRNSRSFGERSTRFFAGLLLAADPNRDSYTRQIQAALAVLSALATEGARMAIEGLIQSGPPDTRPAGEAISDLLRRAGPTGNARLAQVLRRRSACRAYLSALRSLAEMVARTGQDPAVLLGELDEARPGATKAVIAGYRAAGRRQASADLDRAVLAILTSTTRPAELRRHAAAGLTAARGWRLHELLEQILPGDQHGLVPIVNGYLDQVARPVSGELRLIARLLQERSAVLGWDPGSRRVLVRLVRLRPHDHRLSGGAR